MIIRETPKDIENYIKVDNAKARFLQGKGFNPLYMDFEFIYFKNNKEIEKALLEYDKVVSKE